MNPVILYENILRDGTLSASGTDADPDYALNNIVDFKSYSKWKADSLSDPWIEIDLSSAKSPDTIFIYNHNLNEVGGTIKLQYYNAGWNDLETIVPNDTYPIMQIFAAQSSTKFRLFFDTPVVIPELAVLMLGVNIEFPFPPDAPVIPGEESISGSMEISEAGNNLGAVISNFPLKINHKFSNLTRTWFDTYFRPFWFNHARYLIPFAYAWDLVNRPNDVNFVTFDTGQTFRETLTVLSLTDELVLSMKGISSDKNYSPLGES